MIKVTEINKSFGDLHILKNINLHICDNEIVSIVGASGAGKTTLLQIMGTLSRPDSGKVFINDNDISLLKQKQLSNFRNRNIGFVFQFHHLLPEFNALENVCIPGFIAKKKKLEVEERAKELLGFLNLSHRINHKPNQLSGGEKQRVAIARALINDPKVIFADEPTGNLDSKNTNELYDLFFSLRKEFGKTFVIVTHNLSLAERSDKKFIIEDGEIKD